MLRILSTALAVLAITTATLVQPTRTRAALTPGITLIGKGIVSGTALDKSGLTGNICQASATDPFYPPGQVKKLVQ